MSTGELHLVEARFAIRDLCKYVFLAGVVRVEGRRKQCHAAFHERTGFRLDCRS
jgi:hypothetical protein